MQEPRPSRCSGCGDTITLKERPCDELMDGFKDAKPVVFDAISIASDDYEELAASIEKLN